MTPPDNPLLTRRQAAFTAAWPYLLILLVGAVVLLPRLGDFGFWDPWEPKYAESVREMRERGSWAVPYYREEVRLAKPILVYWGILAGSAVFGLAELGARIVGVAMTLASMLGVYYAIELLRGRRAGLLSALVLGTLPLAYLLARQATPDVYLFTSLGSAILFLCLGLFGPDRRRDLHLVVSYACLALALLAKGPVIAGAVYFGPLAIYALWYGAGRTREVRLLLPEVRRQAVRCAVVLLVIAGPWNLAILLHEGPGYLSDSILKHNLLRPAPEIDSTGPSDFYASAVIFGLFPWSCFVPVAAAALVGWWEREAASRYAVEAFMLIAAAVTLGAFSISEIKFAYYLAPLLIPLATAIGLLLDRLLGREQGAVRIIAWSVAALLCVAPLFDLLVAGGAEHIVSSFTVDGAVPPGHEPAPYYTLLLGAFVVLLALNTVARSSLLVGGLVACAVLQASYLSTVFIPRLGMHKTMKHLCETWRRERPPDAPICFHGSMQHGIFFYTDNEIRLASEDQAVAFLDPDRAAYCIVENARLPLVRELYRDNYRGRELDTVDDSHFRYTLVSNRTGRARGTP